MSIILFKVNAHISELSYGIKQTSHNAVRETVWNIAPVNEYEAQSAIIPFVSIIIGKKKELQQCHFTFINRYAATLKESRKCAACSLDQYRY
jgi:hypothetical protein